MITIASRKASRLSLPFIEPLEQRIAPATFVVTTTADTGAGSLRQAIIDANAAANTGAPDVISFNITAGFIITPASLLPEISESVIIDGYSQPGSSVNTATVGTDANIVIGLSGAGLTAGNGLVLGGTGGSIVRGLAVFGFGNGINDSGNAILLKSDNNRVEGNFLGLDPAGTATLATKNGNSGVRVGQFTATTETFTGNVVGGGALADRNLISNNTIGVSTESEAQGTLIINNLIGTDSDGSLAVPNTNAGVIAGGGNTLVGDGSVTGRNVISGNDGRGVLISVASGVQVRGNYIGLSASGTGILPNGEAGIIAQNDARSGVIEGNFIGGNTGDGIQLGSAVGDGGAFGFSVRGNKIGLRTDGSPAPNGGSGVAFYSGSADNLIGGFSMAEGNEIAFNAIAGISFGEANGANRFLGNSIHDNNGLGIDLGAQLPGGNFFGVNPNDPGDTDGITNFPVIGTFTNNGTTQNLSGTYSGAPNTTYRLEFFAMAPSQIDLSGHGEGTVFLGFQDVTTNASGTAPFSFNGSATLPTNSAFTATATGKGRTSEFGPARGNSVTYTWNGSADGDWFRPSNWSPIGVPGPLDIAIYGGAGNSLSLSAPVSVKQFQQTGGALGGTGTLNVLTSFSWTGGSHSGGTLRLVEGSTGGLGAATPLLWSGGALEIRGSLTVSNAGLSFNQGDLRVENAGFLQLNAGITDADGGTTVVTASNFGSIEKFFTGTFGLANINLVNSGTVVSRNGGNFSVGGITQFDGAIELAISNFTSATPMNINGGVLRGNGTVTGNVVFDNGTLVPGYDGDVGSLTFANNVTFTSSGKMKVDIGGATAGQYDTVIVSGSLSLDGSLEHKVTGGFVVNVGNAFTVIDGTNSTGSFANVAGLRPLVAQYALGNVTLAAPGFVVTNTNDSGAGSLRQAIIDANTQPGLDTIAFNIPGGGLKTIAPLSLLPTITGPVVIDGYTQPGSAVNTLALGSNASLLIELSGQNVPNGAGSENGLVINGGGSYVSGLIINRWLSYGMKLDGFVTGKGGNVIVGNWIGPDATGNAAPANGQFGILIDDSPGNRIGSAAPRDRNVISGNDGNGIEIVASSAPNNIIQGNYIGTNAAGNAMLGNGFDGISTQGTGTVIGGSNPGEGNVISASQNSVGILVNLASAAGTIIQGNFIGTDAAGTLDFGNADAGIAVINSPNLLIGGSQTGARNIIAGNGFAGITIEGTGSTGTVVLGNYIGTNAAGTAAIGNDSGILIGFGATGTIIGGTSGGTAGTEGNVISGNVGIGIEINGSTTTNTQIVGNRIGVSGSNAPLGNGSDGLLLNSAMLNQIGIEGAGNIIANNNGAGIKLISGDRNGIRGNSIFNNTGIGIDLGGDGNTPNDANDSDTGANGLLNKPLLTNFSGGANPVVTGTYQGLANATFRLEFFATSAANAAEVEGGQLIGQFVIATDTNGNATFSVPVSPGFPPAAFITATATLNSLNSTSEFSPALATATAASYVWDNDAGDSDWFNPANWDQNNGVPGQFDTAILNIASTINLTAPVTVGTFTQTNGTVAGGGNMTVNSALTWSAGTQTGVGTLFIASGATASITGIGVKTLDRRFIENNGTLTVDGSGAFNIQGGPVITNRGVWDFASDADIRQNDAIGSLFKNEDGATLRKTVGVGGGATVLGLGNQSLAFDNKGAIEVVTGNLTIFGSGGTWTGSTSLNISATALLNFTGGTFTWDGGPSLTGGGTLEIGGTANVSLGVGTTLNVPGGFTLSQTSGVFGGAGTVLVGGVWSWLGGTHSGSGTTSIISTGTLTLAGSGSKVLDTRTLNTLGSVSITGTGDLQLTGAVTITNSSTWNFQTDADINSADATAKTFTNNGIIRKSGGTGDTILSEASPSLRILSDNGTLDVQSGTLSIGGGGSLTNGSGLNIGSGATLRFSGGNTTLDGNPTISGGGLFFIDGGGTFTLNAGTTFAPPAATPLSLTGTLTGAGNLTVSGALSWQNGTMSGAGTTTIAPGATVTADSLFAHVLSQRTLVNNSTILWSNTGDFELNNGAVITNNGVFELRSGAGFSSADNTVKTFTNSGGATFRKAVGTGTSTSSGSSGIVFDNSGLVEVLAGTLNIGLSGTWGGVSNGSSGNGAKLVLSGTKTYDGSVTFSGPGETEFALLSTHTIGTGANVTINPGHAAALLGGGVIDGAGTLIVIGALNVNNGNMTGAGVTNVSSAGLMTVTSGADLNTRTLNNSGTITHISGGFRLLGGAVVNNSGLWEIQGDQGITASGAGGAFANLAGGVLRKSGGTGTSSFAASNVVTNAGTIEAVSGTLAFNNGLTQSAGSMLLNGGSFAGTIITLTGGKMAGTGGVAANVVSNGGIIAPGGSGVVGTISVTGSYTQTAGGTLEVDLAGTGAGQFDVLAVSGSASLAGVLDITNTGGFSPAVGSSFRIINSANSPALFPILTGETLGVVQQPDATGLVVAVNAVTFTWDDDGGDANWFNPLNWDVDTAVPRAGDAVVLNSAANIVLNSPVTVSAFSQSAGSLGGTGTLTVTGGFTWTAGVIGASVTTGATSTNVIGGAGTAATFNGALMQLAGSTMLAGNVDVSTGVGAEIRNAGAFTFAESAGIGGSGLFTNAAGSAGITVSTSGTIFIGTDFAGNGPLSVASGLIDFEGNSVWAVGVAPNVSSGAEIRFSAGTHTLLGANSFTGSGTTLQTSGVLSFEGTSFTVAAGQAFVQSGGSLGGAAELVVDGTFTWTAGNQSGTSMTRVSSTGTLLVTGAASKGLDQRDLRVDAGGLLSVSGDGAIAFQDDVLLEVAGELNVSSGAQFSSSGALSQISILSSGSFIKTGSISNVIDVQFLNAGATTIVEGIVNFTGAFEQTAGYTALAGGGLRFTSPAEFSGGVLKGNGSIAGTINNTGAVVSPGNSPGRFTIEGDYIQGPGGFLLIEIEGILPATGYDQIQVTGNASLDGELDVTISGIVPSPGQVFTAISAGSISGTFASIVLPEPLQARVGAAAVEIVSPFLPPGLLDLSSFTGRNGAFIPGLASGDNTGVSVSGLGSINGDTFGDFAIGAPFAGNGGATYIVFGKTASFGRDFDLASLDGTEGFTIIGGVNGDGTGFSVSSPGDVNGDGIRDILIGDPNYDGAFANSGAAFVVYGRSTSYPAVIDLSALDGTDGFRMDMDAATVFAGTSVSGAGDVNGDGVNDIIIGVPDSNIVAADAGAAFVVFGRAATATPFPSSFVLSSLSGADGFAITGSFVGDRFGTAVGGAGDLNDDGFDDLVIGAPTFNGVSGADSGAVYVVFGKASGFTATLDAGALDGKNGFRMEGRSAAERLGISVSAAGDMNADGIDDLLIAGRFALEPESGGNSGVAYVVFGKTRGYASTLDLAKLNGSNGFRLFTEPKRLSVNVSVSSVGDFNGDGFDDIAVGSPGTGGDAGVTYLMFGRSGGFAPDLSLSTLNATTGFRFRGEVVPDQSGASVSATDVNGDSRADLIIGTPQPGDEAHTAGKGGAYVIYGVATQEIPEVAASGTTITFDDVDGDIISIKATGGKVTADMLVFGPGGVLQLVDLTVTNTLRDGANITFSVRQNGGDGLLNVGAIDATGIQLGTVKITGDLGQIDVGRGDALKPALKQLIVGSLGALGDSTQIPGTEDPLFSEIRGALPKLIVRGAFTNAVFDVLGRLGNATIGGEFSGTGAFTATQFSGLAALGRDVTSQVAGGNTLASSGLSAGSIGTLNIKKSLTNSAVNSGGGISSATVGGSINKGAIVAAGAMRVVKVFGAITSDDPAVPSVVAALASPPSSKPSAAIAINSLVVRGSVLNAEILLGYNQSFEPVNGDASAGKVNIKGSFTASSLVAGVKDDTADGFGQNDVRIGFPAEDPTPKIFSRIASLIISGAAEGSDAAGDSFGITAQQISSARINGVKVVLDKVLKDDIVIGTKGDFRLVEVM